jgi:hypothetical protein
VVISDPTVTEDGLRYNIQTLQGALPAAAGPCVLFIDPLGRPLSPVSSVGANASVTAACGIDHTHPPIRRSGYSAIRAGAAGGGRTT